MIDKSNVSAKNLSKYATSREHGHVEQPPTILRRVAFWQLNKSHLPSHLTCWMKYEKAVMFNDRLQPEDESPAKAFYQIVPTGILMDENEDTKLSEFSQNQKEMNL